MGSIQSWRQAYGALKDSTTVNLAKINSDYKDLDIAVVKATNHVESPPKERHVQKILVATSVTRPREDVVYCVQALSRRLQKTHNWTVALKALMVIHRILKEGGPIFRDELLRFSQRGQMFQISKFKDDSSPLAWDCSAWVRTFGFFLEERLECFKILKYDIGAEPLVKSPQGSNKGLNKGCEELLEQLPALQRPLFRLLGCKPEGAASCSYLIQFALVLVLKESFKIYCAINGAVIDLVDLAGGFDKFLLDSLYDNANIGTQQNVKGYNGCVGPNPLGVQDPFATSNAFPAAPNVQAAAMAQQQMYIERQQQNAQTMPLSSPQFSQPPVEIGPANPLGDPPAGVPQNTLSQGSMNLL